MSLDEEGGWVFGELLIVRKKFYSGGSINSPVFLLKEPRVRNVFINLHVFTFKNGHLMNLSKS